MLNIARNIDIELEINPKFTLTRDQLRNRIETWCDDPDNTIADIDAIFNTMVDHLDDLPLRD